MHPTLKGFLFVSGVTLYAAFLYAINLGMFYCTVYAPVWVIRTIAGVGLLIILSIVSHFAGALLFGKSQH